jgi:hypothetical protein
LENDFRPTKRQNEMKKLFSDKKQTQKNSLG